MGTMIGNILALLLIIVIALVGLVSLDVSTITFITISYSLWLIVFLFNFFTNPSKGAPLCQLLMQEEIETYRRYHLYFWFPVVAEAYSALMNGLRVAGFIWGVVCLWKGLYWLGGVSIAYFFITGGLILKLNPWLYMSAEAQNGNQVAMEQLSLIKRIHAKREAYDVE